MDDEKRLSIVATSMIVSVHFTSRFNFGQLANPHPPAANPSLP